jgi:hypothetical protein
LYKISQLKQVKYIVLRPKLRMYLAVNRVDTIAAQEEEDRVSSEFSIAEFLSKLISTFDKIIGRNYQK